MIQPLLIASPPRRPLPYHVTIIYVVEGVCHIVIAYLDNGLDWRFGDWKTCPEADLPTLLAEAREEGAFISDERKPERPDTPVIIAYRVPLWHALKAVDRLDRAIFATVGKGESMRREWR
jgi:hypothetical protein